MKHNPNTKFCECPECTFGAGGDRKEAFHSSDLLPCPFCGEMPVEGFHDPGAPYPGGYYYVACENDECPMSDVLVEEKSRTEDEVATKEQLRKRWNTRHANNV